MKLLPTIRTQAIRAIQDKEYVMPGTQISLTFDQAIDLYKTAYAEGRSFNKYTILKELLNEHVERETENLREEESHNTVYYGMVSGALDAYKNVLELIRQLEQEVAFDD
jgi:hypothetical protein